MNIETLLGIDSNFTPMGQIELLDAVTRGLPVEALENVAKQVSEDSGFKYRVVPKSTLAMRRRSGRLSNFESERVVRLALVWRHACVVWKNEDEARAFLSRNHPLMDDRRPIDLTLASEYGADVVRQALGRLEVGSAP